MSLNLSDFDDWFRRVTNHSTPFGWQRELASVQDCRSRLIRIPTGLGKTEGVLATWGYHRLHRQDKRWPTRLVWCLPMRVLVEQTHQVASRLFASVAADIRPEIHVLMGGEESSEWILYPERPAILIGTQDMLLSRALNRGYASGRARWPLEFGLVNNDSLWVLDEVQLMDVGLATSAHLQAFRRRAVELDGLATATWWMSATLQPDWLRTVDTAAHFESWIKDPVGVGELEREGGAWGVTKSQVTESIPAKDPKSLAQRILSEHSSLAAGDHGKITLVVCNTVQRACETYDCLRKAGRSAGLELVHSRFRPEERRRWGSAFLSREACTPETDRIIVATQVIEAGVDISADCLITELAPWPSLVQRFGRCSRFGGRGRVLVIDRGRDESSAAPYTVGELESAAEALSGLSDLGILSIERFEQSLTADMRQRLYPYAPRHLLLQHEFEELFDTTPDLTGADLDVSRFIRSGEERDLQVCWLDVVKGGQPPETYQPLRDELCAVPFLVAREWLCGAESKTSRKPRLRSGMRAWVWDWLDGRWSVATRASLLPGRVVLVAADCGGYRTDRGFDPESRAEVPPVGARSEILAVAGNAADFQQGAENLNSDVWKSIASHSDDVIAEALSIGSALHLPAELIRLLELAGRWHDYGKAHEAFQGCIRRDDRPQRLDIAKAPKDAWVSRAQMYVYADGSDRRPGFRHELASVLGVFALVENYEPNHAALTAPWAGLPGFESPRVGSGIAVENRGSSVEQLLRLSADEFDLLVYLIASHHGKVRVSLHASPSDQDYKDQDNRGLPIRGVREGDMLAAISIAIGEAQLPPVAITLEPACLGLSPRTGRSWRERTLALQDRWGSCGLAFLEALFVAADRRASQVNRPDPSMVTEIEQ